MSETVVETKDDEPAQTAPVVVTTPVIIEGDSGESENRDSGQSDDVLIKVGHLESEVERLARENEELRNRPTYSETAEIAASAAEAAVEAATEPEGEPVGEIVEGITAEAAEAAGEAVADAEGATAEAAAEAGDAAAALVEGAELPRGEPERRHWSAGVASWPFHSEGGPFRRGGSDD